MERYHFDFKKLLDDGIIFLTQCMDLSTGEMCKPEIDPMTGEYSDPRDFSNLITLYNIQNPEAGTQDHIFKAMRNLRPDLVDQWQADQKNLVDAKYNQILWGINQKNKRPEDYTIDRPKKEIKRISDIISGQDAYAQNTTPDISLYDTQRFPYHESVKEKEIKCRECGWKWKKDDGGLDPYICHKCGYNNEKYYINKNDTHVPSKI